MKFQTILEWYAPNPPIVTALSYITGQEEMTASSYNFNMKIIAGQPNLELHR